MPTAIIFMNDTVNSTVISTLKTSVEPTPSVETNIARQLEINESMSFVEFNARVAADPNYPFNVHSNGLRILVLLPDFRDYTNRQLADIVIFVKQGLASVEKNNFGPPGLTLPVQRLNIWNLINGIKGSNVACFPFPPPIQGTQTQTPWNPRPPEKMGHRHEEGFGTLELFGTEALEENGMDEGVFGDKLQPHIEDDDDDE